jgi:predicted transcriptional regulator
LSHVKRAYFDIVAHLLTILVDEPHTKTRLSDKAKLDSRGSQRYVQLLVRSGLVSYEDGRLLAITPKGKEFLSQYEKLKLFLEY